MAFIYSRKMLVVEYFPDGRLKMLTIFNKNDKNVRINKNEISVCRRIRELRLEHELMKAVNLWNLLKVTPELREDVDKVLKRYLSKGLENLLDVWG